MKRKICFLIALGITFTTMGASYLYLWRGGAITQLAMATMTFTNPEKVNIRNVKYPVDKIDSITLQTPKNITPERYLDLQTTGFHDMTLTSSIAHRYKMVTAGNDPYVFTEKLQSDLPGDSCVLTFEYKTNKGIPNFKVFFADPLSESRAAILGKLEYTENMWMRASFDLWQYRNDLEWGKKGDYLRLDPGDTGGPTLEIRNMYMRSATPEELAEREAVRLSKQYIDNGKVRLGVDMSRGGSVFYFALSDNQVNLLNHRDEGRFIQQSYYGEADGSEWWGGPWTWNPIQGGGSLGTKAEVKEQEITQTTIHVVSIPVHWAYSNLMPELEMEEMITLEDSVAHIHYTFRNTGEGATDHPVSHHEMPAVFVDYDYNHLRFYNGDKPWTWGELSDVVPGWPNEYHDRTEEWSAYVNTEGYGIGVYTPGTFPITAYQYGKGASTGSNGDDCSYFAPLREFAITKGMVVEYDVYVTIGQLNDIRCRFYRINTSLCRER